MMSPIDEWSPKAIWRRFRLEAEAVKNYPLSYQIVSDGQAPRHILLDDMLPKLLHINATAILGDALMLWLRANGHTLSKPYRDDLNGRVQYLTDQKLITEDDRVQQVRQRRNAFAHEPEARCDWAMLQTDIEVIEQVLLELDLIRPTPTLEAYAKRSAIRDSNEPGVAFERTYEYGVREDGQPALEVKRIQKVYSASH